MSFEDTIQYKQTKPNSFEISSYFAEQRSWMNDEYKTDPKLLLNKVKNIYESPGKALASLGKEPELPDEEYENKPDKYLEEFEDAAHSTLGEFLIIDDTIKEFFPFLSFGLDILNGVEPYYTLVLCRWVAEFNRGLATRIYNID